VTLARAIGDDYILTTAQERRASALLASGRLEETCRVLTGEVIPASEAAGNLWTLISAYDNLAGAYELLGNYQQAHHDAWIQGYEAVSSLMLKATQEPPVV
jgi:hypothetical protein